MATTKEYHISGMTCGSCISKVKEALESIPAVSMAVVKLESPQASVELSDSLDLNEVNVLLKTKGNYEITEHHLSSKLSPLPPIGKTKQSTLPPKSLTTYKPLLIIVSFIIGVSFLVQSPFDSFSWMTWMRHFMAGFFLVFSFFKLLNVRGFATSYAMYDLLAAKWRPWGFIYPFVELGLGICYLINFEPFITNLVTATILGFSSLGVIQSNLQRRKIKCACLGDVFNLPMSTVTIVEDVTMVAMALLMIFLKP